MIELVPGATSQPLRVVLSLTADVEINVHPGETLEQAVQRCRYHLQGLPSKTLMYGASEGIEITNVVSPEGTLPGVVYLQLNAGKLDETLY